MPKYVIQREYLLPVYQYLVIEADTFEEACTEVVGPEHDWDNAEEDYDAINSVRPLIMRFSVSAALPDLCPTGCSRSESAWG